MGLNSSREVSNQSKEVFETWLKLFSLQQYFLNISKFSLMMITTLFISVIFKNSDTTKGTLNPETSSNYNFKIKNNDNLL